MTPEEANRVLKFFMRAQLTAIEVDEFVVARGILVKYANPQLRPMQYPHTQTQTHTTTDVSAGVTDVDQPQTGGPTNFPTLNNNNRSE